MNMCKFILFLSAIFVFNSCASYHKSEIGFVSVNGSKFSEDRNGLIVSASLNEYFSSEYFGLIDFVFENKTGEWLNLHDISISLNNDKLDSTVKVTMGNELDVWLESTIDKKRIDEENKAMLRAGLGVLAYSMMDASKNNTVKTTGAVLLTGLMTSMVISGVKNREKFSTTVDLPAKHLFAGNILIPPGLFVKRWIVLNTNNSTTKVFITKMNLNMKDDSNNSYDINVEFRRMEDGPQVWQSEIFEQNNNKSIKYERID